MAEDASLDDFLDAGDQEADPEEPGDDIVRDDDPEESADVQEDPTDTPAAPDTEAVDPADTTLDWTPGGTACQACDEVVEHRWRDDGALVCESCKDW